MEDQKKAYQFLSLFSLSSQTCDKTLSTLRLRKLQLWEGQRGDGGGKKEERGKGERKGRRRVEGESEEGKERKGEKERGKRDRD